MYYTLTNKGRSNNVSAQMHVLPARKHDIRKNHNQTYPTATE